MKKKNQYKSPIINNHKITKKNDGIPYKGYIASLKLFLDFALKARKNHCVNIQ